jgi:hypothetical protein
MSQAYGENAQQMVDYYNQDVSRKSSVELMIVEKNELKNKTKTRKLKWQQ